MAPLVGELLDRHPENPVNETLYTSGSNKSWTKKYSAIKRLKVHTYVNDAGAVEANYEDAFLSMYEDDELRMQELAYPPNYRQWRMAYEEDGINYFHTEISNIVLAAWTRHPTVLQASHEKPLTDNSVPETVDVAYSVTRGRDRVHVALGEFKRCLIAGEDWQAGKLTPTQQVLSRELRRYADSYRCPQIFCFDNSYFLMLQFRAATVDAIRDPDCAVDCWVFPRDNPNGATLRWALYRLLAQGLRRCQGRWSLTPTLYSVAPDRREFYNGRPLWRIDGFLKTKPWGHRRRIDPVYGAFYWTDAEGEEPLIDERGKKVWDTLKIWEPEPADVEMEQTEMAVEQEMELSGSGAGIPDHEAGPSM